ncbi:5'-nucleotidase C-terminal domain-containing protein [Nonlabens ulvanivorans]|uniref:5'-nucleotidase n=1 Tax=Nonlabens ulvanivorans TaxID=906888 RepID=A0ABX5E259_NONUL|nr:5'-nucleotidase [Nonlabens ulvanivorans]PRX12777.1 5'-nucleotidase [Nonlabens ulvanivorans]
MKTSIYKRLGKAFFYLAFAKALLITTSCKSDHLQLTKISSSQTHIDSTLQSVVQIDEYIAPFKKSLDAQMDEQLSFNPASMNKNDYKYNTPIGNMLAAIVREQGAPIYKSRTGKDIDVVLLNHGGIRAGMPAGPVTMRRAYEIMPFDNEITIVELTGEKMNELINYIIDRKKAHPFDGMQIILNADNSVNMVTIQNKPLDKDKIYTVATSDYLYSGGDDMSFFKDAPMVKIDYKIRNATIDYFKKVDTIKFEHDNRFEVLD